MAKESKVRIKTPSFAGPSSPGFPRSRGFLFTLLALVLISFIFISIQLWAQTVQVEEARSAQRFRVEAMRTSLSMVDNDALNKFSNASAILALDTLARAIEDHPDSGVMGLPVEGGAGTAFPDGTGAVNRTIYELMTGGTTSGGIYPGGQNFFYYGNSSNLTYSPDGMRSTLPYFFNQTRTATRLMGYDLVWGDVRKFSFNQTGLWAVSVYFEVPMNLTDPNGQLSIQKMFVVNTSIDISGMTDPMVARQDRIARPAVPDAERPHRNVYHVPQYLASGDAQARLLKASPTISEGMGWFFGPMSTVNQSAFRSTDYRYNLSKIGSYILETPDMGEAISQSQYFGAIVLGNSGGDNFDFNSTLPGPTSACSYAVMDQHPNCLYCLRKFLPNNTDPAACPPKSAEVNPDTIPANPNIPYVAITGSVNTLPGHENWNLGLPEILIQSRVNQSDLFGQGRIYRNDYNSLSRKFSNDYPPAAQSRIYDMSGPRDMAICGYYVQSPYGPSYLQRLTALAPYNGHTPYSPQGFGIESFITGRWAGGADDPVPDWTNAAQAAEDIPNLDSERNSRLDYQFYSPAPCAGSFIEGMPGCKSMAMCANDQPQGSPRADATGRFSISNQSYDAGVPSPSERYNLSQIQYVDKSMPVNRCD